MQVEQKFLSHCSEPPGALLKCSVCLGRAGVRDSAFVLVKVWLDQSGGSRLRRGGAEEPDGVQHLPTTAQPCCLQEGRGGSYIHCTGRPLTLPASSPLWSGLFCPSSRINLSQNEQGQGHSFGDCWEALWMGSPQIADNYFVCLNKAGQQRWHWPIRVWLPDLSFQALVKLCNLLIKVDTLILLNVTAGNPGIQSKPS